MAKNDTFTPEERAAMRERAKEQKAEARAQKNRAEGEQQLLAKIAELPDDERALAQQIHELITANAPALWPKLWYGMPAYAKDGKILCFFQSAHKFNTRYATLGFTDSANLDDGPLWPASFAVTAITPEVAEQIAALVKKAISEP